MNQLSFSIKQAAALSGNSQSFIRTLITKNILTEKDGSLVSHKINKNYHYLITRKGMEKLTGYKFEKLNYIEFTKEILKQVGVSGGVGR